MLLGGGDGIDFEVLAGIVEGAHHGHLLGGEFLRRLLVAEHVRLLCFGVVQDVLAVHAFDALDDALGVVAHLHVFVVGVGAHVVGDDAGEGLWAGGEGHGGRGENNCNLLLHWILPLLFSIFCPNRTVYGYLQRTILIVGSLRRALSHRSTRRACRVFQRL